MLMSRMTPDTFGKLNRLAMRSCDSAGLYALTRLAVYRSTVISDSVYFYFCHFDQFNHHISKKN